jgi:hypothetical protein
MLGMAMLASKYNARTMTFRFEKQMLSPAESWLGAQGLSVKREFTTPWGVCDLVAAALNPAHVEKRLALKQRRTIGPLSRVGLLLELPDVETRCAMRRATLCSKFAGFFSPDEVDSELTALEENGFVRRSGKQSYQKVNGWMPLHSRLVAVELKRHRVEDALSQARKNKELTWESYVGLPSGLAERLCETPRRLSFEADGVGLLSLGASEARVLVPARKDGSGANRTIEAHCMERFWTSGLKAVQH